MGIYFKTVKYHILKYLLIFIPLFLFGQSNIDRQKEWFNNWLKERDGYSLVKYPKIKHGVSLKAEGRYTKHNNTITLYNKLDTTVLVHELTHCYQSEIRVDDDNYIDKIIMPCLYTLNKPLRNYWLQPHELHSRIMELRFINNLSPCVEVTSLTFLIVPEELNLIQFLKPNELLDLLNNLY